MRNNKGFAISLMLYAMILLIVTIFYIVLAIVKNRFTYSEEMVNNVVSFLDLHDTTMGHGDKTGPLVVFNPGATAFRTESKVTINIYDDNDGKGIDLSSIKIMINKSTVYPNGGGAVKVIKLENKHCVFEVTMPTNTPYNENYNVLYVSVQDQVGNYSQTLPRMIKEDKNTYSYQSYGYTLTGPICSIKGPYRRIRILIRESDTKLDPEPAGANVSEELNGKFYYYKLSYEDISSATSSVPSGEDVYYSIECSGANGINAYLNPTDFVDNANLKVQNVIVIKGINRTKAIVQVKATYPAESPGCITSNLALKDTNYITDSIGNDTGTLNFPSVNICLVNETITN